MKHPPFAIVVLCLLALSISVTSAATPTTLVPFGSVWKYLDNGSDQGTAWRAPGFNDSAWASGPAQLGYSSNPPENDEATIVSYGPDPNNKFTTTYFRRAFVVSSASSVTNLTVSVLRDDGAVVYLNGTEIFRSNMPAGPVDYLTFALIAVGGADETINFYQNSVAPGLLTNGTNVLAVEIHQANLTSTDISFDLELSGTAFPPNQGPSAN